MENNPRHFYIIAGESSGDLLGARLMEALQRKLDDHARFSGIGGTRMEQAGLESLFPFDELALMGFAEIIPHIIHLKRRIKETVQHILETKPDAVITIDSPGFNCRVVKALREAGVKDIPFIHYVAPTVWAYKPERAQKFAALFDFLMVILPFEPPYFEAVGLPCKFVGHPIVRERHEGDYKGFRQKHGVLPAAPILTLFPGSRKTEINRHLPIFRATVERLLQSFPQLSLVVVSPPHLYSFMCEKMADWPPNALLITDINEKRDALSATTVALSKSGTVALEINLAKVAAIVTYKTSAFTAWLLRRMIKVKYVNLVNLLLNKPVIPELLQEKCNPQALADEVSRYLQHADLRHAQVAEAQQALALLDTPAHTSPSDVAAETILEVMNKPKI